MPKNRLIAGKRILVANRGEIATRIFRAATELNMRTIGIYSYEDRFSVHRFKADEAYATSEPGDPLGAYLDWQRIIELALWQKADAIHPGYGFLSENADFAKACEDNDIMFCGPPSEILEMFGDKIRAKQVAAEAGLNLIPGSDTPLPTVEEALRLGEKIGYPLTLKAVSGGGGKGIRFVHSEKELREKYELAKSEAKSSFGQSDIYIEKTIVNPKHIEVQILGDGELCVHLFERDCSIQRRHQKVIELAPAVGISEETRSDLLAQAVQIGQKVRYRGVGTVEFLVDEKGEAYFLEVNPRVQVEHTVTEVITGIDIVQASILLAGHRPLHHPAMAIKNQDSIQKRGVAIQCRITTEDPQHDFAPDTGTIVAYRPAQGFGIRLDEGLGTSGGTVTPYYDSLLVKVTAYSLDFFGAVRKMRRALKEFRIRGVKHNIPLLVNIISHPHFAEGKFNTSFFASHKEVFTFSPPKDRATKLLAYIAEVTVNNPHNLQSKIPPSKDLLAPLPSFESQESYQKPTAKEIFDQNGTEGLITWIQQKSNLLLTDTTMRDAHQSLFATRLRTFDMLRIAPYYNEKAAGFFSLEMWGGATFDTSLRFLKEDPWERLAKLRESMPRILLQMLIRGDNAVGYSNYPEWVIRHFIRLAKEHGLDLFRIFDCLNNPSQMAVAIDEVKKNGGIAEASLCYTGNLSDPSRTKYDLKYYLDIASELKTMGTDLIAIKDMAGLLRPQAAEILVKALKEDIGLPVHLHTHATAGASIATLLAAHKAGCDIIDGAVSSMAGFTSQPSLNAVVACLEGGSGAPDVTLAVLDELGPYWESIRTQYQGFDPGINASSTRVYEHEIPGGQYSNLYDQARKVGVKAQEFYELTKRYQEVNQLFGDIVKVTPSSKVVGDFALLLQKNNLTGPEFLAKKPKLDYPHSVVSFFKGHMGIPKGGFREDIRELVLGPNPPPPKLPTPDPEDTFESAIKQLTNILGEPPTPAQVLSYRLYPKVFQEFLDHSKLYGFVERLPTLVYFYGIHAGEEFTVEIEPGKTLFIRLNGISEPNQKGERQVFFQLNGFNRETSVVDQSLEAAKNARPKASPSDPFQIGAPMPGKVSEIKIKVGDQVAVGEPLFVTESMKMEYALTAKAKGQVAEILVEKGAIVEEGDLLCRLS